MYYQDQDGEVHSLPATWTSVAGDDPVAVLGGGRAHFRVADLLVLADLLRQLEGQP